MGENSAIQWTDHTWNPWHGCFKVSPGCKLCYMYRDKKRYGQRPDIVTRSKTMFDAPLKWKEPAKVFTCSWSDFFIEEADVWRAEAWKVIRDTPHLTYQILTKRPERIIESLPDDWPYPNVWLGISAESQRYFDERWTPLWLLNANVQFVSAEPLLGPLSVGPLKPDWVIAGGETGRASEVRFTDDNWFRSLRDECKQNGIPFFLKQITRNGHPLPFEQWPEDLQVRQFPAGRLAE